MTADPYSSEVRALFAHLAHAGNLADGVAVGRDDQGVCIRLFARIRAGRIEAMRFLAWGCPHFLAAAESLCARYEGRPASDLNAVTAAEFMQSPGVPVEKTGRILVIQDAAHALCGALLANSPTRN